LYTLKFWLAAASEPAFGTEWHPASTTTTSNENVRIRRITTQFTTASADPNRTPVVTAVPGSPVSSPQVRQCPRSTFRQRLPVTDPSRMVHVSFRVNLRFRSCATHKMSKSLLNLNGSLDGLANREFGLGSKNQQFHPQE
jgi:hypothetical protein